MRKDFTERYTLRKVPGEKNHAIRGRKKNRKKITIIKNPSKNCLIFRHLEEVRSITGDFSRKTT